LICFSQKKRLLLLQNDENAKNFWLVPADAKMGAGRSVAKWPFLKRVSLAAEDWETENFVSLAPKKIRHAGGRLRGAWDYEIMEQ